MFQGWILLLLSWFHLRCEIGVILLSAPLLCRTSCLTLMNWVNGGCTVCLLIFTLCKMLYWCVSALTTAATAGLFCWTQTTRQKYGSKPCRPHATSSLPGMWLMKRRKKVRDVSLFFFFLGEGRGGTMGNFPSKITFNLAYLPWLTSAIRDSYLLFLPRTKITSP